MQGHKIPRHDDQQNYYNLTDNKCAIITTIIDNRYCAPHPLYNHINLILVDKNLTFDSGIPILGIRNAIFKHI